MVEPCFFQYLFQDLFFFSGTICFQNKKYLWTVHCKIVFVRTHTRWQLNWLFLLRDKINRQCDVGLLKCFLIWAYLLFKPVKVMQWMLYICDSSISLKQEKKNMMDLFLVLKIILVVAFNFFLRYHFTDIHASTVGKHFFFDKLRTIWWIYFLHSNNSDLHNGLDISQFGNFSSFKNSMGFFLECQQSSLHGLGLGVELSSKSILGDGMFLFYFT